MGGAGGNKQPCANKVLLKSIFGKAVQCSRDYIVDVGELARPHVAAREPALDGQNETHPAGLK